MSIQPLILKNGVISPPRSPTDVSALLASIGLGNVNNTSDLSKPISTATQTALDLKANLVSPNLSGTPTAPTATAGTNTTQVANCIYVNTAVSNLVASSPATLDTLNELATALGNDANFSTTVTNSLANKVDLITNQTINGVKIFSGSLQLPNNAGTTVGTIWRSGNNLEYKDGANATKIILNSAGNLSNLMDKQIALNNLVNGQVANRVLRSDGTNVTLSQVNLLTDVINSLPVTLGGTGSSTQNFVDLTTNQTISGIKSFNNTTNSTSTTTGSVIVGGGLGVAGNLILGGMLATTTNLGTSNTGAKGFQAGVDVAGNVTISLFGGTTNNLCYVDFSVNTNVDFDARVIASTTELAISTSGTYYFNLGTRVKGSFPTSATGLPTGTIWRNGNVLNIV